MNTHDVVEWTLDEFVQHLKADSADPNEKYVVEIKHMHPYEDVYVTQWVLTKAKQYAGRRQYVPTPMNKHGKPV